jgi:hypothetical protein
VFVLLEARLAMGLLHPVAIQAHQPAGECFCLSTRGSKAVKHGFCAACGCGAFTETSDWSTGKPDFDNLRISVNSRLFDDFDLDKIEVVVIDGRNLW